VLATLTASPWLRLPLVVIAALAVQTSVATDVRPFHAAADVMVLVAVCGGFVAGPQQGALVGFVTGLAYDLVLHTPFGLSALTYALAAYTCGYLQAGVAAARWWLAALAVGAASAGAEALYALLGTVFGLEDALTLHLLTIVAVVGVVNVLLAPLGLFVMRWALHGGDHRLP
jgi:rod shape-determining protein MreD